MGTVSTTATPTSGHTTHLQFEYSPDQINSICQKQIEILKGKIEKIAQLKPNDCTFSSTSLELEKVTRNFGNNLNPILFLKYVSPSHEIREAADKCENEVQQLFVEIYTRSDLFSSFKSAEKQMSSLPEKDKKLFEESLLSFRRNGLDLSEEQRKVFITKKKRLVAIESEFANRLVNETTTLEFSLEELKGLPQSYIESLEKSANGNYKLTMSYPHYYPFMQNAQNSDARKKYEYLFNNRGGDANRALLEEAIQLRSDLSHMLGFKNHSEFVLEQRMAKNPTQVRSFLEDLVRQLQPKAKQELQEMVEEKKKELGLQETQIYAWDWRYYENILRKTKYNIDPQVIKEYFPLEVVLKGMFEVYQTLFEVKFVEEASSEVWHSSVKKYKIQKGQETIAYFFMDLFPRTGKYGHAAAFTLISGFDRDDSTYELPISSIVANFNPPSPENPSLLPHNEVETLFHEFGHIMHQTLTRAKYSAFSGTNVKTDFVEAPSQMLENWVWKKETLQKLSGHYSDPAKKLPEAMIERMIQAKLLNVGIQTLRQLAFSTIDLDYHTSSKVDSTQIYSNRMNEIMLIPIQQGTQPQSSFGHLMGGYDSGYYGYMWSKVFAQDMFTRFEAEGLLNPETGKDYYDWILKPGGEREPLDLITGFLKREPSNKAFLKSIGL